MCGRYSLDADIDELINRYKAIIRHRESYNKKEVFPTDIQPILINNASKNTEIIFAKWGFSPSFAKQPIINARAETINEKPLFRKAFLTSRCLIPVTSFFEWEKVENKKIKRKILIESEKVFSLAGIIDQEGAFSIITTCANPQLEKIHDRMPVIIEKEYEEFWINDANTDEKTLISLLVPYKYPFIIE